VKVIARDRCAAPPVRMAEARAHLTPPPTLTCAEGPTSLAAPDAAAGVSAYTPFEDGV